MSSSGVRGGANDTSKQVDALTVEVDALTADDEALDTRVDTLEGAPIPAFVALSDVVTPGPTSPVDGNLYVTRAGGVMLCPRSVEKDDTKFAAWLATDIATLTAPFLIARHSVPAGTQSSAYASTSFTATGGCQLPCAWSISTAGDALPTGMTFVDNGDNTATLAGTPSVNGTFNIIVHAQDALGAVDDQPYQLVIAAVAAPFAFALPVFADFHVGDTVNHSLANDATNPAGALSFTSYNASPTTGCASNVIANTITKTGLSIANGKAVCIQGLSATTGISNDTVYRVVNSATGSIQLSLTTGGAPIDLTGANDAALTIQFPTLPAHHIQQSGSTLSTSVPFTSADIGSTNFAITAFDGTTHITATATIKVLAVSGGPTITTTSLAGGTKNSAYTPVILTLTDPDPGALPLDGTTGLWSIDPSGDALPAGMTIVTAFGNGAIGGTPTVFGTFNLVLRVVDNNGLFDTQAVQLVIADVTAAFTFPLPNPLPDATTGTDYLYDASTICAHPVGALSFDSYNPTPVTAVTSDVTANTLTWSGGVASIANGTTVALEGLGATTGIVNGPATTYFVVNSGTRSIKLAATLGGAAIDLLGSNQSANITIQFPTLPNKHFVLDPATGKITALGAQISAAVAFWMRAFDTVTHIARATAIGVSAGGASIDIATIGLVTGDLSGLTRAQQIATATANANKLNSAAETMRTKTPQGALTSTLARGTVINGYNSNPGAAIWHSGASGSPGLNKWHLNGAELRTLDNMPIGNEGYAGRDFFLQYATAPELDFTVNGNGANQAQVDFTRTSGAKLGYSAHPVSVWNCGPVKWGQFVNGVCVNPFISKNGRAVTGATANGITIVGHPGTRSDGAWPASECFDVESHRNHGADSGWIKAFTDDGSYVDTRFTVLPGHGDANNHLITACSGFKSHFQAGNMSNVLIQVGIKATPGSGRRHGLGGFDAGRVSVGAGGYAVYCAHGANIEGGNLNRSQYDITETFNLGDGSSYTSFETQNCDIGIVLNGNPAAIQTININGYTSTNDGTMIVTQGTAPSDGYYLTKVRVTTPKQAVTNFNGPAAAQTHLVDCKHHLTGGAKVDAGTPAADGVWGTF